MRKPERDYFHSVESTGEYKARISNQVNELKLILAQEKIVVDQKTIERAFLHPYFDWAESGLEKISYPSPGDDLMVNPFPKPKKKDKASKRKSKK